MTKRYILSASRRRADRRLTLTELKREIQLLAERLTRTHARLPNGTAEDVGLQIAGAFRSLHTAAVMLLVADSTEELVLLQAIPVIRKAATMGFRGFGGSRFAAAIAMNRVLFDGKLSYCAVVNDELNEACRAIGHTTLFSKGASGVRRHFDADARIKSDAEIEEWGRLDVEDLDYQEIASELGVAWTEEAAASIALFEATETDILQLVGDEQLVTELELILSRAAEELDREVDFGSLAPSKRRRTPIEHATPDLESEGFSR